MKKLSDVLLKDFHLTGTYDFFKSSLGKEPEFSDITDDLLEKYVKYLDDTSKASDSHKRSLVCILNKAKKYIQSEDYLEILKYDNYKRKFSFCLSEEQMREWLEFKPRKMFAYLRDVFSVMMLTGASWDETLGFSSENVVNGNLLFTRKGEDISIPLSDTSREIVLRLDSEKHNISYRQKSYGLRKLFKDANLVDYVKIGNELIHVCDLACPTIALSTFATRMYNKGMDMQTIQHYIGMNYKTTRSLIVGFKTKRERRNFFDI